MPVRRIIGGVFLLLQLLLLLQNLSLSLSLLISASSSSPSSSSSYSSSSSSWNTIIKMESTKSSTALHSTTLSSSTSTSPPAVRHQIPVDETGVSLLRRHAPQADGRHVRLAILDTGCDLAARGLQTTTTGKPKYLDFIDCTGDGDIDMRTTATVKVEHTNNTATVTGVTGKSLTLPYDIFGGSAAPTTVRVGAIALYQILPKTALKRVQAQQKTQFLQRHNARIAQAQYDLDLLLLQQQQQQSGKEKSNSNDKKESNPDKDKEESNNTIIIIETVTTKDDTNTTNANATKDDGNTATTAKDDATNNNNTTSTTASASTTSATVLLKKQIKEAQLLLEELQDMTKDYSDSAGPVMDAVLYESTTATTLGENNDTTTTTTSNKWQALIDIDATGDLSNATPMAPYAVHHQFATLGFGSHVTFCLQVYDKGDVLSLVCDSGSHGTHVAGIAAANYNGATETTTTETKTNTSSSSSTLLFPLSNGVAPGAQILACKIGDVRVASAETGTGLIRALAAAKRYNCHLINLSFGEPSWQPDRGRVAQVFEDAVYKWGMAVFTSAGNDGPALSTLGSPGTLSSLITVGAYISPQMMMDQYSTLMDTNNNKNNNNNNDGDDDENSLPAASYSFSSRGPTPCGRLPDICAPGGAIAPVPRHTLQSKSQKHGTSMASPSACGVAAVLLSALKEKGIDIDDATIFGPNELRRALVNSAIQTPDNHDTTADNTSTSATTTTNNKNKIVLDPFAQGAGLVSAPRALKYAMAHHGKLGQDLAFDVKISSSNNARGIFIRDALQLAGPMTKTVSVRPLFEHSLQKSDDEMDQLLSLELDLDLIPSHDWVHCPDRITLLSAKERGAGQTFSIRIDPRRLPPGAHYATVNAIDSKDPERGPLFQVPITVIVPHTIVNTPPFTFADNGNVVPSTQIFGSGDANKQNKGDITIGENGIDVSMLYELTPGTPERRFLSVPALAEWATIKIRSATPIADRAAPHSLILHAVPFARGDLHNQMVQIKQFFSLNEGTERSYHVQVKGGSTLEVCLQLSWLANPSPASVMTDVEFHSYHVRPPNFMASQPLRISSALEFARFGVGAPFRSEKINPKATLTAVHRTIRPKEYKISAASFDADRDLLPIGDAEKRAAVASGDSSGDGNDEKSNVEGKLVYKSLMKYTFKLAESKDDATISVTPRIPSLFLQLYDSPIDSQLWMLQDENGKVLGYGACIHEAAAVPLNNKSGAEYTLTLRISHPNRAVLEQLKDLPLRLSMKLSKELECPVYSTLDKASTPGVTDDGREQVKIVLLRQGAHSDLYVTRPTAKLPDWVQHGDVMFGNIKLNQKSEGATSLDLFYEVPPKSTVADVNKKKDDKKDNGKDDKKSLEDELAESVFKAKVDHLAKLRKKKSAEAYQLLANGLKAEKRDSLLLLEELLTNAKETKPPEVDAVENESRWRAVKVREAVDAMKNSSGGPIDEAAIAQYYGCNNNPSPDDAEEEDDQKEEREKTKKEMEEGRKAWRSALLAKAGAWSDLLMSSEEDCSEEDKTAFEGAIQDMKKWVGTASDLSSDEEKVRHAVVIACHMRICQGRIVGALSSLRKARKELPGKFYKQLSEELVKVLKKVIGMEYWLEQVEKDLAERYPKAKAVLI